jgi:nucleotide-binding universal stress UspA family protein
MIEPALFKYILIPFDGSPSSSKAIDVGLAMAKAFGSRVALLTVEEYIPRFAGDIGEVKEEKERQNQFFAGIQRETRESAKLQGLDFERADILAGHVAQNIITHAQAIQCDLIVMGHSGRSGVWASFLGSTVEKVSRYAHCTVVIVR